MRVLIVEDDRRIASFIGKGLTAEGHAVRHAETVEQTFALLAEGRFDIILLDLLLPDGHGRDVLKRIRLHDSDTAVIVVSALGDTAEKVELLDAGADDYLVKPFAFAELSARVRAAVRHGGSHGRVLRAGSIELDTRTRTVTTPAGASVALPAREYELLEYLMRHAGQAITRQHLLDAVWDINFDPGSNVVDVYIGYLRRKIDAPNEPSAIETVRGVGYRVSA